jgi:hypothetical protein
VRAFRTLIVAACLARLLAAAQGVQPYLQPSDAITTSDLIYRPPSAQLREHADAIDRQDAAIRELGNAIAACSDTTPEGSK